MAINNIINDQWQGHSHGEVENALKALLATMLQDIEAAGIPSGGVTADMLAQSLQTLINGKYSKPGTGIPASDLEGNIPSSKLAQAVQTSLGKADSALQGVKDSSGNLLVPTDGVVTLPESEGGGSSVAPDSAMSSTSENTVQNKVIKAYVDTAIAAKANAADLASVATSGSYNDLTNKPTIPDVSGLATKSEVATGLATKQDTISDLSTIRTGAGKGATAIQGVIVGGNEVTPDANKKVTIPAGVDGVTPHIGQNGNWWVGETDTGVHAQGPAGNVNITDASQLVTILVNDLTTGGAGNILTAEMGKVLNNKFKSVDIEDADLMVADEQGNVLVSLYGGHVETKHFNSRQVTTNTNAIQQLQSQIGQQGSVQTDVVVKEDADAAFDIADESGRVALRITSKGHIKTKGFDSENMDIFRATKLDSPQCICHGYGASTGQANSLTYFRNGLAKGYKFFEVDGVDCRDGVTVCTHSNSTYSVKNKSTGETESIVFSEIDSTDLLTNYTWPNDEPIAMLKDVIWLICYFHRCPLHVDGQGMTKASRYAASAYAESLGVGQYVFHELSSGIYNDWDIPCNAIVYCGNIGNQIAANKKSNNNIIFYFASNFFQSEEHLKSLADTIHAGGCYLMSWTFNNIDTIRTWFRCGADFLITSGKTNNEV